MLKLPGYQVVDKLIENKLWTLYKAYSISDQKVVGIKKINKDTKRPQNHAEVVHDFHVTKELASNFVLQPIKLERYGNQIYLVTELFTGVTLADLLKQSSLHVKDFLKVAIRISSIVSMLHQAHVIHKSLQPQNILLNHKMDDVKLTGFHQSTHLSTETQYPNESPFQLKERVFYMAPEQTGRMNRFLDNRADLYSLGVIFYQLVTGRLPFQAEHPAEVIHAHLARVPIAPSEIDDNIPTTISTIIMTLLEKMPESRYQSAGGLKEDLDTCLRQVNEFGEISPFKLKEKDTVRFDERASRLYGRETEVNQLIEQFDRVRNNGSECLFVNGPSGIGKTALINELHKPLVREKGYFVSGKFVQLEKEIPYAPIIQAFQGLMRHIMSEGEESVEKWGRMVKQELAPYSAVIANFIPEVKWLIGPQAEVPELPPGGVHNRFRQAIRKFVGIFAKEEHPLVLFLDDLQWADDASLDLIEHLVTTTDKQHLLVIGSYRDNEIYLGHPLELMLKNLKSKEVAVSHIQVDHLSNQHIGEWIKETLSIKESEAVFLEDLIFRITQGNPFFITQVFQSLQHEGIISYDSVEEKWNLHIESLKQIPINETIIDFILKRINRLPEETIVTLQLASCFGNRFDLSSLARITGKSYHQLAVNLWQGLEEGLIVPLDASYKWVYPNENLTLLDEHPPIYYFLHDKVQQAFYMRLSTKDRGENHLQIGLELLKHYDSQEIEEHIFDFVNHLNYSRHLLPNQKKLELVKWNYLAGERAKNRAAKESALHFFTIGKELLPEAKWDKVHYDATFKIMIGLGESQYLNHLFEEAEATFDETLGHANSNLEKLRIYDLKIMLYTHIHQVEKATEAGLDGLSLFNWNFKRNPNKLDIAKEYMLTQIALKQKKNVDLLKLPTVKDKDLKLIMRTLINTNAPTYHFNQNLATILMLRALRLTLRHGDMDITALVYNNYALTLSAGFNDYDVSYQFGKLAIEHVEKYQDNSLKARVYFVFASFVNHWKKHISYNLEYLERSQKLCIESGNLHLAGASSAFIGLILFIKGENLEDVSDGIKRQIDFANQNEYALSNDFLGEVINWIEVLADKDKKVIWNFPTFTDDPSAVIIHYTIRLQMTYLFKNEEQALTIMEKLESLVDDILILVIAPDYYFYHALWLAKFMQKGSLSINQGKAKIKKKLAKLENWANHSPTNYLHKYLLVKGELARVEGNNEAIHLYNRAIRLAEENGYMQDAALASECAANYYLDKNLPKSAKTYLVDAYHSYRFWGAKRIAYDISQKHPELLGESNQETAATIEMENQSLDINTIFEAAGVISGEIILTKLLKKLMHIVLTSAGGEHAHLFLTRDGGLQLAASSYMNGDVLVHENNEQSSDLRNYSEPLVHYVAHTKEAIVLADAARKGVFTEDRYISEKLAKSVLCLPIIYQQNVTGVLYLENNQATDVFTNDSIALLTMLASQAATSIENAYLYANLEDKISSRTMMLNEANRNLTEVNKSLFESEQLRSKLLSNISHDLRSPIATIQGYVDAILNGLVDNSEQQMNYIHVIKRRITLLNNLVQDLFDLAQLESGNTSFSMEIVPVDQLFNQLCSQFELEINKAGLNYQFEIDPYSEEDFPVVEVDIQRIEQVLDNLVSNAIKNSEKGTIQISLSLENTSEAIFSVEDQGSGIKASEIAYVFDRFYTNYNQKKQQGHGLGLSIVKEIIEAHNGKIWVNSKEGSGATFSFSLKVF
ncbi:ATP-binding sensor histidine kinase [Aquibacillus saliphilus]|uniref:ATP-binding sensor histidine kinase n=1 Tax=Aquibacillus saliphilus TaxID=1909422 RepID=UPI001CF036A4|nr:ATP-binding sensor histidine kinase [Aquibacillus saliphilus]